jgi:hypothetical protein
MPTLLALFNLFKYLFIFLVILALLNLFYMFQKLFLLLRRIADIKQELVKVFQVPFHVGANVLNKGGIYVGQK